MPETPFFTVIVPTYNQVRYLGEALDSLLAQTDPDWEAVIVNDGSTDDTAQVIDAYCRKDHRFRAFHKPNGGAGSALNVGLREAHGEWICWLSSDDLFMPTKLEIHRQWITQHPDCQYFYTLFKELDDTTSTLSDAALWVSIPDQKWQVLTMLRCIIFYGNSICIHRDAWHKAGSFDESLRYAQDYDMFLRLLALYPATFIPERTCIARVHPSQSTHGFRDACFFDSAKSAINFINSHSFPELVPWVDLTDSDAARDAVKHALETAAQSKGFLYALGPHLALILRILEWAWSVQAQPVAKAVHPLITEWITSRSRIETDTPYGYLLKAAAAAVQLPKVQFAYHSIPPSQVAETWYWQLKGQKNPKADALRRYLEKFDQRLLPAEISPLSGNCREIVFVNQLGAQMSHVNGSFRATLEVAKCLMRSGCSVLFVGQSEHGLGYHEGVLFVGACDEQSVERAVKLLSPIDTLVGISRGDIVPWASAQRYLIYAHGPHAPRRISIKTVNRLRITVVCPSKDSHDARISEGIKPALVRVVPNAYDPVVFCPSNKGRHPHSLIFAANVAHYKGADIALQAFQVIRGRFPDATLQIYGRSHSWQSVNPDPISADSDRPHHFAPSWLDDRGYPAWPAIERDLPGCSYRGQATPKELAKAFQQTSLLIMPSRTETFGLVSLEAQACGCLPVLPRQCGFPETMHDTVTGYLYDTNSPEVLANTITELWNRELPTNAQRSEAQVWVRATFSWESSALTFLKIIEAAPFRRHSFYYSRILFYRAWLWQQVKTKLQERSLAVWWGLMKWTKPVRRALGLSNTSFGRFIGTVITRR